MRMSDKQLPDGVEWPRFEDGELVKPGDVMYARDFAASEEIDCIFFEENGTTVKTTSGNYRWVKKNEKIKRPPVLDKDGKEIKVDDTVWDENGKKWEVKDVNHNDPGWVTCEQPEVRDDKINRITRQKIRAKCLTHTPPDSWERLREDARKSHVDYWGCKGDTCAECPALIGGLSPDDRYDAANCVVAGRLDILTRAEKLAGVVDDE